MEIEKRDSSEHPQFDEGSCLSSSSSGFVGRGTGASL